MAEVRPAIFGGCRPHSLETECLQRLEMRERPGACTLSLMWRRFLEEAKPIIRHAVVAGTLILSTNLLGVITRKLIQGPAADFLLAVDRYLVIAILTLFGTYTAAILIIRLVSTFQTELLALAAATTTIGAIVGRLAAKVLLVAIVFFATLAGVGLWIASHWFHRSNFVVSCVAVAIPLIYMFRSSAYRKLTWKRLADLWLKTAGVPALTVGGFGVLGLGSETDRTKLLAVAVKKSQVSEELLFSLYLLAILAIGIASLLTLVGKSVAESEDTQSPTSFFRPAFVAAWIGNFGLYVLFIDAVFLTIAAKVGPAA